MQGIEHFGSRSNYPWALQSLPELGIEDEYTTAVDTFTD